MHKYVSTIQTGDGAELIVPYHPSNNLPTISTSNNNQISINITADIKPTKYNIFNPVAEETNQNLLLAQKELIVWYWRLSHIGFQWLQMMMTSQQDMPPLDNNELAKPVMILTKNER